MQFIRSLIKKQLNINSSSNLLFENVAHIMSVEPGFSAALEELLNTDINNATEYLSSEFITFTTKELVKRLYAIDPYLPISPAQIKDLEQIYRDTWKRMIKTRNVKTTLNKFHYPALAAWLTALYPEKFQKLLKRAPSVGYVTYQEYSAELQVKVFGIDLSRIKQPIIDIGCGSQANLVRYLNFVGIDTYGIDRNLEVNESYLNQVNWFDYHFEPGRWGSIVSNMSFTNHLDYAYLHDVSQLERYLLKLKEIVESLSTNGCFYYSPSLPFVEDRLSSQSYKVERERKTDDVSVSKVIRIE